ncbi:MAG: GNAT family N-acetyltransferase [Anaerolineales bacterium]
MRIEVIESADQWSALAAEWRALLNHTHQHTPFLTYEFQRAWWQQLGGGEWQDAQLHILVGRAADGRALGIAPLFRAQDANGLATLHFIGSHEIADFLDFIARPEDLNGFIQSVSTHLASLPKDKWQTLDLYNLLDSSGTPSVLRTTTEGLDWTFDQTTLQPSPYLIVPKDLDGYMEMLGAKQGHELRRKLRRAARSPEPITLELISDPAELPPALEDFFALMTQEADKARFLTPAMRVQMDAIARATFDAGWLQLLFLNVGDKRMAGYMNFDYDNCIWAYNAGFSNGHANLSPGWLIMAEMVRWCAEHGRRVFDFMRGGEKYKYRFGAIDRFVQRVTITRN